MCNKLSLTKANNYDISLSLSHSNIYIFAYVYDKSEFDPVFRGRKESFNEILDRLIVKLNVISKCSINKNSQLCKTRVDFFWKSLLK